MSRIRLVIDRVALQGFDAAERKAVVEGLRGEMERLLADREAQAGWKSQRRPVLRLGNVPQQPGIAGSRALGGQIARAVGRSLKP